MQDAEEGSIGDKGIVFRSRPWIAGASQNFPLALPYHP